MIYIFDMDGTLVDSNEVIHNGIGPYFLANGIEYTSDVKQRTIASGYLDTAKFMVNDYGVNKPVDTVCEELKSITTKAYEEFIPAKPYAGDLVNRLKNEGHRLFILSASPQTMIVPCLKRLKMIDCFETIWSTEDFGYSKDNTELYIDVAKKLSVRINECIVIDDSIVPVRTAKKAGAIVYAVYDKTSEIFKEEMKKIADRYLNDLSEF